MVRVEKYHKFGEKDDITTAIEKNKLVQIKED